MVTFDAPRWSDVAAAVVRAYPTAVVYDDPDTDTVLHEGEVRILANEWVELPTGRLLSPGRDLPH